MIPKSIDMNDLSSSLGLGEPFSPVNFCVDTPELVKEFMDGEDELWVADVKAHSPDGFYEEFNQVFFIEGKGVAFIAGIEHEGVSPEYLNAAQWRNQQSLILFLRDQTRKFNKSIGLMADLFSGAQYSSEQRASMAYLVASERCSAIGIGFYESGDEGYTLLKIDVDDDSLELARSLPRFYEI